MNFEVRFYPEIIKNTDLDQITFDLWAERLFSIANRQPESAINIAGLHWQGMNEICRFTQVPMI